jgi:small subunit ribosomal protein S2
MAIVSMKALLESGVHFGHRTHKWNPAMKPYIFTERNGIHIIDLQKTVKALDHGYNLVRDAVAESGTVLFVGTKRQAQDTIRDEAERVEMPYVTTRWLGGMLTNWRTIRQRVNELDRLERMRDRGEFSLITKKEGLILQRKMDRLEYLLGGIRTMTGLPDLLFVVDVYREETAIHEANLLEIPVIAMVDTNCDPRTVDYVIPSNDDAIRAIKLLVGKMADAVMEGKALRKEEEIEAIPEEAVMAISEEPELSDEDLLGEATLAKLPSRQPTTVEDVSEAAPDVDIEVEAETTSDVEAAAEYVEEIAEAVEEQTEDVEEVAEVVEEQAEDVEEVAEVVEEQAEDVEEIAEVVEEQAEDVEEEVETSEEASESEPVDSADDVEEPDNEEVQGE